jgi:hypothetical protein
MYLPWNPRNPWGQGTSCTQLLWKPRAPCREGAPIYLITFETSRPMGQGTVHVSSYCGSPTIRAGKAHAFQYFPRKPRDVSRQGTPIYVVTRGNLKNVYACVLQFRSGVRSYRENPNNVYLCILYYRISTWRTFT